MAQTLFYGDSIIGSIALQTSVAGQEILSNTITNFQLINDQNCTISINGSDYTFLRANQGVYLSYEDFRVNSVKIQESGITFNWIATKRGDS